MAERDFMSAPPPPITLLESLLIEPLGNSTEADLGVEFRKLFFKQQ